MTRFGAILASATVGLAAGKTALLIVDVQECFLETGTLPVTASFIIPKINSIREKKSCLFDKVFKSQDFHPPGHVSFGSTHDAPLITGAWQANLDQMCIKASSGKSADASCCPVFHINSTAASCTAGFFCPAADYYTKAPGNGIITGNAACTTCTAAEVKNPDKCFRNTQVLWRDHCMQGASGDAGFAKNLTSMATDVVVQKGTNKFVDAYSAFMDNSQNLMTSLDSQLQTAGIKTLYIAGIATDVCVKWTVRDALQSKTGNYTVKVISDASAGIWGLGADTNDQTESDAWMTAKGATVMKTADVLAMACPTTATSTGSTAGTGSLTSGASTTASLQGLLLTFAAALLTTLV